MERFDEHFDKYQGEIESWLEYESGTQHYTTGRTLKLYKECKNCILVGKEVGLSRSSVRLIVTSFEFGGIEAVRPKPRGRRPNKGKGSIGQLLLGL